MLLSIPLWSYFNICFTSCPLLHISLSIPLWSYFNMISCSSRLSMVCFQSHFGLISTHGDRRSSRSYRANRFQSHFGLISTDARWRHLRSRRGSLSIPLWSYFNRAAWTRCSIQPILSIPLWSYFNHYINIAGAHNCGLSIPLWSYFNARNVEWPDNNDFLSIPLWSYFNGIAAEDKYAARITFNPTLVLFQPAQRIEHNPHPRGFQSHFGLISTTLSWRSSCAERRFQSHFGLISTWREGVKKWGRGHFQSHFGLISTAPHLS